MATKSRIITKVGKKYLAYADKENVIVDTTPTPVTVRIDALENVDLVVNVQILDAYPDTAIYKERGIKITGNVVRMTMQAAAGTTVALRVFALGT